MSKEGVKLWLSGNKGEGKYVLVDKENYGWLNNYKWHLSHNNYATRSRRKTEHNLYPSRWIRMHSEILKVNKNKFVDHIKSNTLDKRKSNLREVTLQQNQWNKASAANGYNYFAIKEFEEYARLNSVEFMEKSEWSKYRYSTSSQYKGDSYFKSTGKWRSYIYFSKKNNYIGYFETEKEAAIARNKKIVELGLDIVNVQNVNCGYKEELVSIKILENNLSMILKYLVKSKTYFFMRICDINPLALKPKYSVPQNKYDSLLYYKNHLFPLEFKSTKDICKEIGLEVINTEKRINNRYYINKLLDEILQNRISQPSIS